MLNERAADRPIYGSFADARHHRAGCRKRELKGHPTRADRLLRRFDFGDDLEQRT